MNTTYVAYLDNGCVEWTRENEIIGLAKAKETGLKMAKKCGRDTFFWQSVINGSLMFRM